MEKLEYWKLCTEFTVVQAALIVCGIPPEEMQWQVESMTESRCPGGYVAIRTALKHALDSGRIRPAHVVNVHDDEGNRTQYIDVLSTTIAAEEIDRFLKSSGVICEFFDRMALDSEKADLARTSMPTKLAAALKAWSAVSNDPSRLRGKSPKQALELWLTENASALSLLNRDGTTNRTGIEEICKVANWKPGGGATPTPALGSPQPSLPATRPLIRLPPPRPPFSADFNDEIPF